MPYNTLKYMIFIFLSLVLLMPGGPPFSTAQAEEHKAEEQASKPAKEEAEPEKDGKEDTTEMVQLQSFPIRTYNLDGSRAPQAMITVYLQVADQSRATYVCQVAPRLRHAVLQELRRSPVYRTPDGQVPVDGLRDRFFPAIQEAIGYPLLLNIAVLDELRRMNSGPTLLMPESTSKCRRLSKKEEEKKESGPSEGGGH